MRTPWFIPLVLTLSAIAAPAFANNPYDVSWASLDPGSDWSAVVLRSLFPIPGATAGIATGNEATVIGQIVAQFTGFVGAIACAFLAYNVVMNIHRAAETSRILGTGQTWMFVVRTGFAGVMMFPLGGGFSAGQALVMQGAMAGIGMAASLYNNAVQAVGPDAITIAQPMVPGTQTIVEGLIASELCMDLVNAAANATLVPTPAGVVIPPSTSGGPGSVLVYNYNLAAGDSIGDPACGSVSLSESAANSKTIAGVTVDMGAVQQSVLNNVLTGSIRSQVASVASNLWTTKQASALTPLQGILTSAVNSYTTQLTTAASSVGSALNAAVAAQTQQARNGNSDLLAGEVQQSTLGWTAAGAYYLEIAKLNAATMSLLSATPQTTAPTYAGLGPALMSDLAPVITAANAFTTTLHQEVSTTDGTSPPTGAPQTLADARSTATGTNLLSQIFGQLGLSKSILSSVTGFILPLGSEWRDPFGSLMQLGQTLINTALAAMGAAALLASSTISTGSAIWSAFTLNWAASAAIVAGHAVMSFIGGPLFVLLLGLLVPGLTIAYVLPMIPYVMWMAGVLGWIILVCEAMIAVPLWMLAHMTFGGDGLHGRAVEGWGLLFNVVFRPSLMVIGLFLGYFVFDCMSWLIRESFGIAAGFVLSNGWVVSNFLGLTVLLTIFVMTHVVAAMMSFRMVALLPHHLPRLIGFTAASRVDMDDVQNRAAYLAGGSAAGATSRTLRDGGENFAKRMNALIGAPPRRIAGPQGAEPESGAGLDTTLRATTDSGEDRSEEG